MINRGDSGASREEKKRKPRQSKVGDFFLNGEVVGKRKNDLSKYFHPSNSDLNKKFLLLYKLADCNDNSFGQEVGVVRQTMNRYRHGIWIPDQDLQIKICKKLSEKIGKHVDSQMLWGNLPLEVKQ